jgi:tryptophan synthase alpha chain
VSLSAIFASGRTAFIPYVMAGDPDLETTQAILAVLARRGASAIELGIPYGDPLADGATIAAAGTRALANGTTIADVLSLVAGFRAAGGPPIIVFTYFNPIYQYGLDAFARDAAGAGASAVIVPDIALEESDELRATLVRHGLEMPLMVAPSTSPERAVRIAAASGGFVYVVSRLGVTGAAATPDFSPLRDQVVRLRTVTDKPLAVGFGVSTAQHVSQVAPLVDGIIVGSALIDAYDGAHGQEAATRVEHLIERLFA